MKTFSSEAAVIGIINEALKDAGSKATAHYYKDSQPVDTIVRTVLFRVAVDTKDEAVVNDVSDIGSRSSIDRSISYRGGQIELTDIGEVRYLFFEAKINPFEED
jgi:hypothetical protein